MVENEELNEEQMQVLNYFKDGKNIFLTGAAGTGKSFLIKKLISYSKFFHPEKKIAVTATTACAALLIIDGAQTINAWAGIGLANRNDSEVVKDVTSNSRKRKAWRKTDILIVDEVSMLSSRIFGILDTIARKIRKNDLPFGGIQVIFSGDFHQLPPVKDIYLGSGEFCFENTKWCETFKSECHVLLKQNYRQAGDMIYNQILHEIRSGKISSSSCKLLKSRLNQGVEELHQTTIPVKLYPTAKVVDKINTFYNDQLESSAKQFSITVNEKLRTIDISGGLKDKILKSNSIRSQSTIIKIGSQVMCTSNIDMRSNRPICNGSCGKVIKFSENSYPIVRFSNGKIMEIKPICRDVTFQNIDYQYHQLPLILAWALTIHKSQGVSLEMAEIDIGETVFAPGQTYVALSRVRSLEGLYLKALDFTKIKMKKKVMSFYREIEKNMLSFAQVQK